MSNLPITSIPIKTRNSRKKTIFFHSYRFIPSIGSGKEWVIHSDVATD